MDRDEETLSVLKLPNCVYSLVKILYINPESLLILEHKLTHNVLTLQDVQSLGAADYISSVSPTNFQDVNNGISTPNTNHIGVFNDDH